MILWNLAILLESRADFLARISCEMCQNLAILPESSVNFSPESSVKFVESSVNFCQIPQRF